MIAREWRGLTRRADGDAYAAYLAETGVAECRATPGNRGVLVLRRERGSRTEFRFLSLWESLEAVGGFAGEELERARYYPRDAEYLLGMPPRVHHFEVAVGVLGGGDEF